VATGGVPPPNQADYTSSNGCAGPVRTGCQLDVNNINAAAAFPLTDFNVNVLKHKSTGPHDFIKARCDADHALDLRTKFFYKTGTTTQIVNAKKAC
jgi:hypothetical protein